MEVQKINAIIFSNDYKNAQTLEEFFRKHPESGCKLDLCPLKITTEEMFLRYGPQLILVDFGSFSDEELQHLISKLEKVGDIVPLVGILTPELKPHALQFVKYGMRDFIELPVQEKEILKVIQRFRRSGTPQSSRKLGKVYTFLNFKGGVGNTFVTVNTAISVAKLTKKRVLLWDMALQAGDIPFFLNYKPEFSLMDISHNIDRVDDKYLRGVLPPTEHGISILPAPARIEDIEQLTSPIIEKMLDAFMVYFDYIFIDGGYRLTDQLISIIDNSCHIFITSTLELISLRSASRCLEFLEQLKYSPEKIKIIINRYSSKYEAINLSKAKEILRYNFAHFFSNDYAGACQSVNMGQAIINAAHGSPLNAQFKDFAKKIEADFQSEKKDMRMFLGFKQALKKVIHP
ncbi:MAG TPA: AAA family ATPase [Candidatus Omnitrophota bacterium]|nr:AAA family ATPase [Candidatus Omnitrophota bacterium]